MRIITCMMALAAWAAVGARLEALCGAEPDRALEIPLLPADLTVGENARGAHFFVPACGEREDEEGRVTSYEAQIPEARDRKDGTARRTIRLEVRGRGLQDARLFRNEEGGLRTEVPRLGMADRWAVFGPIEVKGLLPLDAVAYFMVQEGREGACMWKSVSLRPRQCLAGEAVIEGVRRRIGLMDQNFNGTFGDACSQGLKDGDWLLFDHDGDGRFDLKKANSPEWIVEKAPEAVGLARLLEFGGRWWEVRAGDRTLRLEPLESHVLELDFQSWYQCDLATIVPGGQRLRMRMNAGERSVLVPRGSALAGYEVSMGPWCLSGRFPEPRALGEPNAGTVRVEMGPPLRIRPSVQRVEEGFRLGYEGMVGRAGETVEWNPGCATLRLALELVITDAAGREVLRHAMSEYGPTRPVACVWSARNHSRGAYLARITSQVLGFDGRVADLWSGQAVSEAVQVTVD
jgi:hypothetical protein